MKKYTNEEVKIFLENSHHDYSNLNQILTSDDFEDSETKQLVSEIDEKIQLLNAHLGIEIKKKTNKKPPKDDEDGAVMA